jgi:hypothetical protein
LGIGGRFAEISSNPFPGNEQTQTIVFYLRGKGCDIPKNKEIEKNNLESKITGNLFPFLVNSEIEIFSPFMEISNFEFYNCNK